jgi:tRNA(Ile)-lysidine synthase
MNLDTAFNQFAEQQFPHLRSQRVLLAVSGGPDSIALLHLFAANTSHIAVAHCNFSLRGAESDQDEAFVKQICSELAIHCYSKRFETAQYATEQSMSIQVAARNLRYEWFNELLAEHQFDRIATAHHLDDNVETVLLNMVRGTGMKGLSGIPVQNGPLIRPLLFATKKQLIAYLDVNRHPYRKDASNEENKYTRNKMRNTILPQLLELNPQAGDHINELSRHARFAYSLIKEKTEKLASQYLSAGAQSAVLTYTTISLDTFAPFYLYELIAPYGFNPTQCETIHENFTAGKSGSRFLSDTHELLSDRETLIITSLAQTQNTFPAISISKLPSQTISLPAGQYIMELIDRSSIAEYLPGHLYINADNLSFPVTCRPWKQGDSFQPLGSPGSKKISDFLIDLKINRVEKRKIYILENETEGIIAVLDHRIHNRFKLNPQTQTVLHIYNKGDHR